MGMYDSIDRLVNLCDEVIESDSPGLRQKVVARYMTAFGNIIERETGTAVKLALADLRFAAEEKDEGGFAEKAKDALDLASKAAGLVPTVASAIGALAKLFSA